MPKPPRSTFSCPNCGAEVRAGAKSCPECGADEETGWSEDTMYDGLDLPDPGYGPDDSADTRATAHGLRRVGTFRLVAIFILVALLAFLLLRLW